MLLVPETKQPHEFACLPTCIWAVLTYRGIQIQYQEIEELCLLGPFGALQEIAIQSLREEGFDIDELGEVDRESIQTAVDTERPIVVSVYPAGLISDEFAHAVVVCGLVDESTVRVMDPGIGAYRDLPIDEFFAQVQFGLTGAFHIGAAPERDAT